MATLTSSLVVRLIDQVTSPARGVGRALLGLERTAKGVGGTFGQRLGGAIERNNAALDRSRGRLLDAAGGFFILKEALGAPISAAADFETALEDIGQKAGIPVEQLGALGERIKAVARDTNQATMSIAASIDALVGRGATEDVALAAAGPIGKAATAYGAATDDLAAASWSAVDNLKVPADQIERALDGMAQAGKAGAFELKDMATYFPALGAAYQGLGQKGLPAVNDLAAALQIVRKGTGDSSSAATNLLNVLQKIGSNTTRKNFKKLGVDLEKEMKRAADRGLTPIEAIAEVTNKALGGDLSKLGLIFEDAQVQGGLRSIIQGFDEYKKIREEAANSKGVVDADFQRRIATAKGAIDRWNASLQNLNISIGTTLVPLLTDLLDKVIPLIDGVGQWTAANPELTRTIVAVAAGAMAFKIAINALSFVGLLGRGGALSLLSLGFNTVGRSIIGASRAAKSAIGLQEALAAMSGAKFGGFSRFAVGLRGIALAVPGVSALGGALGVIGTAIAGISLPVWGAFALVAAAVAAIGISIWKNWDYVSSSLAGVGDAIGGLLTSVPGVNETFGVLATMGRNISKDWGEAMGIMQGFGNWIGGFFKQNILTEEDKAAARESARKWAQGIVDGIKTLVASIPGFFVGLGGQILAAIGSIDLGSLIKIPDLSSGVKSMFAPLGNTNNVGRVPRGGNAPTGHRKTGGPVWPGGSFEVNEDGREMFIPSTSGKVVPAGGGEKRSVTFGDFHFHGLSGDPGQLKQAVKDALKSEIDKLTRGAHSDSGARA